MVNGEKSKSGYTGTPRGETDVYYDRMVHVLTSLIGKRVEVQVREGNAKWEGIFSECSQLDSSGMEIKLQVPNPSNPSTP